MILSDHLKVHRAQEDGRKMIGKVLNFCFEIEFYLRIAVVKLSDHLTTVARLQNWT